MVDLIKGIDISIIQGKVDFKAVADTGVKFVICRCGVGNNGIDSLYKQNIANAKEAGLKVMAYHFIFPLPTIPSQPLRDPKAQAKMHADAAGGELAACDLEWPAPQDWKKWGCTAAQIVQWSIDYLEAYEEFTGIRPIVYTYPNFAQNINLPESFGQKYKLWIASYTATPNVPKPWTDWVLWQDSGGDKQKLPNGTPVDTNKAKDLSLWGTQVDAVPTPPPNLVAVVTAPVLVPSPPAEPPPSPIEPPDPVEPTTVSNKNFFELIMQVLTNLFKKK